MMHGNINIQFSMFAREAVCQSRKTAEASEIFKQAVFQLVVLGVNPSRGSKHGSRMVLNRDSREDEGKNPSHCCNCFPCAQNGVRSCIVVLDSHSCLFKNFDNFVLTSSVSAHVFMN